MSLVSVLFFTLYTFGLIAIFWMIFWLCAYNFYLNSPTQSFGQYIMSFLSIRKTKFWIVLSTFVFALLWPFVFLLCKAKWPVFASFFDFIKTTPFVMANGIFYIFFFPFGLLRSGLFIINALKNNLNPRLFYYLAYFSYFFVWALYIALAITIIRTHRIKLAFVLYAILFILLCLNIHGCVEIIRKPMNMQASF